MLGKTLKQIACVVLFMSRQKRTASSKVKPFLSYVYVAANKYDISILNVYLTGLNY